MGHCLWLVPKPVSVQSLVEWEFLTFKIFAGTIDEMSGYKKTEPNCPWLAFPIQVHQCARCLLFCGCDFRSWWCCLHIILDWLLASWAMDLWSGAPAIYFGCLQKVKQTHSIGRWFLSQLDCKYPRCSICWCYCQIPWALGHSLWGGFATWGRRLMYAVFLISGQHTAKSAYSLQELISGCGDIWPLGENMEIMGSREL